MLEDPINFEAKRMERIGDLFGRQRVPARLLMTYDQAKRYCPICGAVEPRAVMGGYQPRECEHLYELRQAGQRAHDLNVAKAKDQAKQEQQATAQECYGWLGEEYSEQGLEHLRFETFVPYAPYVTDQITAKSVAQTWAKEPRGTLIFCGGCGCGKTLLACAIANLCLSAGMLCRFTTEPNLFNAIAERQGYKQSYQDILVRLYTAPLLFIDDAGKIPTTQFRQSVWFEVFNKRMNRKLPTVLTTNVEIREDASELAGVLGDAAASRLNVGLELVALHGEDYRKRMIGRGKDDITL